MRFGLKIYIRFTFTFRDRSHILLQPETAKVHLDTLCAISTVAMKAEVNTHNLFQTSMAKGNYMPTFCSPSQFLPGRDGLVSMVVLHLHRYEPIKLIHSANTEQSFSSREAHSSQSVRPKPEYQSDSPPSGCIKLEVITKRSFLRFLDLQMRSSCFIVYLTAEL